MAIAFNAPPTPGPLPPTLTPATAAPTASTLLPARPPKTLAMVALLVPARTTVAAAPAPLAPTLRTDRASNALLTRRPAPGPPPKGAATTVPVELNAPTAVGALAAPRVRHPPRAKAAILAPREPISKGTTARTALTVPLHSPLDRPPNRLASTRVALSAHSPTVTVAASLAPLILGEVDLLDRAPSALPGRIPMDRPAR